MLFEAPQGFLLGTGFEDSAEEVLHPVVAIRGRLVENIPLEVGLAAVPDAAREAGPQSLL